MKHNIIKKTLLASVVATTVFSTGVIPIPTDGQVHAASSSTSKYTKIQNAIKVGAHYLGTPYLFGSSRSTTATFDCSDLMKYIFKRGAGITIPGSSRTQAAYVKKYSTVKTSWSSLKRGDLVFFMSYHGSSKSSYAKYKKSEQRVTHVALYLGNGRILHTYSNKSGGVRTDYIKGTQWEYRMLFGGSVV